MDFFENIKLEKKFNLITANVYKELESFPSRIRLSDFILKSFNFSNINNLKIDSLFEVSQTFMDQVVCTKSNLLKKLQSVYENKSFDLDNIKFLIDNNKLSSIVNLNYDNTFCSNSRVKKLSPFDQTGFTVGKTKIYKPMGDLETLDTCVITKQDFRKLKVLPFYKSYFDGIRYELKLRKNIILAFDQEDSDFFEILDFIFGDYPTALKEIYMVIKDEITDEKLLKFIKKYNIQVLKYDSLEFLNKLVGTLKEDIEKTLAVENVEIKEIPAEKVEEKQEETSEQEVKEEVKEKEAEESLQEEKQKDIKGEVLVQEELEVKKEESIFDIKENRTFEDEKVKSQNLESKIESLKLLLAKRESEVKERLQELKIEEPENKEIVEESQEKLSEENLETTQIKEETKEILDEKIEENQKEILEETLEQEVKEEVEEKEILENLQEEKQEEVQEEVLEQQEESENKKEEETVEESKEEKIEIPKENIEPKEVLIEKNIKLETALENKYSSSGLNSFPINYSNIPESLDFSEIEVVGNAEMKIGEHINSCFMRILSTKDKEVSLLEIKSRELRLRFSIIYDTPGMFKVTNDYLQYEISSNITHGRAIVVFEMLESLFSGISMGFSFKNLSGQISLNNPIELIKIKTALNLFRLAKSAGIKIQMNKLENIENIFYKINLELLLQDESYTTWCNYEIDKNNINPQDNLIFKRVYKLDKKNIEETIILKKPVAEKDIVDDKIIGKSKVCTVHLKKLRGEF